MELIESDLKMILAVFYHLDKVSAVDGVHEVTIKIKNDCGDEITIGYGESGDPCVLGVESESEPFKLNPVTPPYPIIPNFIPTYPNITPTLPNYPIVNDLT